MNAALLTEHLGRIFTVKSGKEKNEIKALDDVSLEVPRGELFGLLGPNGAGKTTLIKILSTLLLPTTGKGYVGGFDLEGDPRPIRRIINMVAGGEYSGYGILNVRENLLMFSQFYNRDLKTANAVIDRLLKLTGMEEKARTRVNQLSTGMRQKMNLARGFINDPQIVFLDEPTLGLDVSSSREMRAFVRSWVKEEPHRSVILTTHYMAEADELCDRVAIINGGRIIACDTPSRLKKSASQESVFEVVARCGEENWKEFMEIDGVKAFTSVPGKEGDTLHFRFVLHDDRPLERIFAMLLHRGAGVLSVRKTDPTLEDVFMELCGRGLDDGNGQLS